MYDMGCQEIADTCKPVVINIQKTISVIVFCFDQAVTPKIPAALPAKAGTARHGITVHDDEYEWVDLNAPFWDYKKPSGETLRA